MYSTRAMNNKVIKTIITSLFLAISSYVSAEAEEARLNYTTASHVNGQEIKLTVTDEGWDQSWSDSGEMKNLILSNRVVFMAYTTATTFTPEEKTLLIAKALTDCKKIKDFVYSEQVAILLEKSSAWEIQSVDYKVPETTINTVNKDRVSMRCHMNFISKEK